MTDTRKEPAKAPPSIQVAALKVARAVNLLSDEPERLKATCAAHNWNDEVAYTIENAIERLGIALATLTTWQEDIEECEAGSDEI